jgi:tyrosyl-tRNA synthetase
MGVELQMGGADQYGNITAGLELIRRTAARDEQEAPDAFALAYPLLLSPSGAKFGKTESGDSVWLHPDGTSPYAFYQHWLNTDDRDVAVYLRWFTTKAPDEIEALDAELAAHPEARASQRALAIDVTARVHGAAIARAVADASAALFDPAPITDPARLQSLHELVGGFTTHAPDLPAATVLADAGLVASRGEARRLIQGGGVTVNGQRLTDGAAPLPAPIGGQWYEVRIGKRRRDIGRLIAA